MFHLCPLSECAGLCALARKQRWHMWGFAVKCFWATGNYWSCLVPMKGWWNLGVKLVSGVANHGSGGVWVYWLLWLGKREWAPFENSIFFFKKKFLCYLPSRCSSVENNLLAASDGVEICPVVFRNLAFISNAESNYDIIFLEDDLNFFSPMFCLGEWGFPHYINVMVVYNWFLTRSLPCF